jgi:hypothetical protein
MAGRFFKRDGIARGRTGESGQCRQVRKMMNTARSAAALSKNGPEK